MLKGIVSGEEKDIVRIPMKGKQLIPEIVQGGVASSTGGFIDSNSRLRSNYISVKPGTAYTLDAGNLYTSTGAFYKDGAYVSAAYAAMEKQLTFTVPDNANQVVVSFRPYVTTDVIAPSDISGYMLNEGSTPLPYEPYGYQEGWEVRDSQDRLIWGREDELQTTTGTLPLKGYGVPVKVKSLLGSGQQSGTPTPDNPVMPEFVGVRTGNLFPLDVNKLHVGRIENDGTIDYEVGTITVGTNSVTYQANEAWRGFYTDYIRANENEKLTFSPNTSSNIALSCSCYDENGNFLGKAPAQSTASIRTFTTLAGTKNVRISVTSSFAEYTITNPMLNLGSTALPYEPYGWAEKITCAGQTVPVYLGQTQTVRRIKKLVLTEEKAYTRETAYDRFITVFPNAKIKGLRLTQVYCTHFLSVYDGRSLVDVPNNSIYSSDVANNRFFIKTTEYTTAEDFKAYLAAQYAAGTPVTVWYVLAEPETAIVNEPLCKIGDYADELNDTVATLPEIPTTTGQNTLTVDTTLAPSNLTVKGHIKALT